MKECIWDLNSEEDVENGTAKGHESKSRMIYVCIAYRRGGGGA